MKCAMIILLTLEIIELFDMIYEVYLCFGALSDLEKYSILGRIYSKGAIYGAIFMNIVVTLAILFCLYVFGAYLFKDHPKSVDRKKLVLGLNVLLLKAVVIRTLAAIIMYSTGAPLLMLTGMSGWLGGLPVYCCIPGCWYSSFKNWWRVMNNEEVL